MAMKGQFSPQITVEDIIKLALPAGTAVIAGETGLGREVTWAVAQRSRLPAFPYLKGGEIALVSMESLRLAHDDVPFSQLVRQLADKGVAAVGIVGEVPAGAEELANSLSIPLLVLPGDVNLRELESLISRTITERRTEMYKWEMELHQRFTRISVEGEGVQAVIEALAEVTGQAAVFEDEDSAVHWASSGFPRLGLILPFARDNAFSEWAKTLDQGLFDVPIKKLALPGTDLARLVAPVVVRKRIIGYLSLLGQPELLDEWRRHALSGAVAACAMEMARKMAVVEVENRFKGEFVDSLVEGAVMSFEEISNRGKSLGYDPACPYLVAVARLDPPRRPKIPGVQATGNLPEREAEFVTFFLEELGKLRCDCLTRAREGVAVALCPLEGEEADPAVTQGVVEKARKLAVLRMNGGEASAGLGRHHPGLKGIATSYQEAQQALAIAQSLLGGNCSAYFGNLGSYRLLFLLRESPELHDFYQETLGKLAEYDRKNGSDLVETLETFFSCDGNVEKAAQSLYLHRNTLAYRLRRIEQLTGLRLKNLEDSFRLQLALKVRKVMQTSPSP